MASTAPAAGLRSPRRASGLNSGSRRLGELDEELELFAMLRRLLGARLVPDGLLQRGPVLQQQRVERPEIDEQHPALERRERAAPQPGASGEVDVERGRRLRRQRQPQRLAPGVELRGDPFDLLRRQIAGIGELQQQGHQEFALDRRGPAHRVEPKRLALEPVRAGARERPEQLAPFRRNPALAAIEPELRVVAQMNDLPPDRAPAGAHAICCAAADRRSRGRMPRSTPGIPASGRTAPARAGLRSWASGSRARRTAPSGCARGRSHGRRRANTASSTAGVRRAVRAASLRSSATMLALRDERIVDRKRRQPALGGAGIAEGS